MPKPTTSATSAIVRVERPRWALAGEKLLEALIRVCGVSAIIFVLAIFLFVFREAAPVLASPGFDLGQFRRPVGKAGIDSPAQFTRHPGSPSIAVEELAW